MITKNLSTLKIHRLTQSQYERELANGTIDEEALYLTPEENMDDVVLITVNDIDNICNTNFQFVNADDKGVTF